MNRTIAPLIICLTLLTASVPAQNLFVAGPADGTIYEISPSGAQSVFYSGLTYGAAGLAFDSAGDLFVTDYTRYVYEFKNDNGVLSATPSIFASGLSDPDGLAFDATGDLFVGCASSIIEFVNNNGTLSTTPKTFTTSVNAAAGLAFDKAGDLFEADYNTGEVKEFKNNNGTLSSSATIFAVGLPGAAGLTFDSAGDLFVASALNIYELVNHNGSLSPTPSTFAQADHPYGLVFDGAGNLFMASFYDHTVSEYKNSSGGLSSSPAPVYSMPEGAWGLAFQPPAFSPPSCAQNLFVVSAGDDTISVISPDGAQSVFYSGLNDPSQLAFDAAGNLFVGCDALGTNLFEFQNNGGTLSTTPKRLTPTAEFIYGLAFDSGGDLFLAADTEILELKNNNGTLSATPTTFAGAPGSGEVWGVAFDTAGDLFVVDGAVNAYEYKNNGGTLSSTPTLFSTGLSADETPGFPALAFDNAGDLFVSDGVAVVEFINTAGTLSSTPTPFVSGLDGKAGMTFDCAGNLYMADLQNTSVNVFPNVAGTLSWIPTVYASTDYYSPWGLAFQPTVSCCQPKSLKITSLSPRQIELTWTGCGTLEEKTGLGGTWTPLPNATSPYIVTITGTSPKFFRMSCQ